MKQPKLAVYTAATKGYDDLRQPETIRDDTEYFCFSNNIQEPALGVWKIRPIPFSTKDPIRLVRFAKLQPEKVLPDHPASLWIDSNITLTDEIQNRAFDCLLSDVVFSTLPHSVRSSVFDEAIMCLRCNRGLPKEIVRQMRFLISEKFPDDVGLKETCIVFRKHGEALVRDFDSLWWSVLSKFSTRDQLGCDYSLWKTKIPFVPFSDRTLLSRCQHRHRPNSIQLKKLGFFSQCYRRFYLMQALYLYMKNKLNTTLHP